MVHRAAFSAIFILVALSLTRTCLMRGKNISIFPRPDLASFIGASSFSWSSRVVGTHLRGVISENLKHTKQTTDSQQVRAMNPLPPEPTAWNPEDAENLLNELDSLMDATDAGQWLMSALYDVTNPILTTDENRRRFWRPYASGEKPMREFFSAWLQYTPIPEHSEGKPTSIFPSGNGSHIVPDANGVAYYITPWDHLANTIPGLYLTNEHKAFKAWFVKFLNLHGEWINSIESSKPIPQWLAYKGSPEHPFRISEYEVPEGGFKTYNQFFLHGIKDFETKRPLDSPEDDRIIVSPNDGGTFFLQDKSTLPEKRGDRFDVQHTFQHYGKYFVGGTILDSVLWFTDYHYFVAPVSGEIVHMCEWQGSYNYDFDEFDPTDPYHPGPLPPDSDRAGWYKNLPRHKRFNWVIKADLPELGYVGMSAIGFWGVGSIHNLIPHMQYHVKKGERMGHFNYGGSSIVLAFGPDTPSITWAVNGTHLSDPDHPTPVLTVEEYRMS